MAVPSSRTLNYDALLSLTLEYTRKKLFDQVFSDSVFLAALYGKFGKRKKQGKGIRMINGGERIRIPLMYEANTTAKSYSGYDVLDVTPSDGITAAFATWRQAAVSIAISRKEERQNSGEAALVGLLDSKIDQARMSLTQELNYQLLGKTVSSGAWSAGNSGKDLDPLGLYLPKDPTASVSVENINQATYAWWRGRTVDGSAAHAGKDAGAERGFLCSSWANLISAMRYCYNRCTIGAGGSPDLIISDQLSYESYEGALDTRSRIVNESDGPVSAGFTSIKFKGADMVWDEMIPDLDGGYVYSSSSWSTGTMFFLNLEFLELVMDSETDFITTPFVRPENQDAKVAQILAMMNLTCTNRRKLGVLYGIPVPVTA